MKNPRFLSDEKYEVLIVLAPDKEHIPYLWIGDRDGNKHSTINPRQMDAIAKHWCRHRGIKP